MARYISQWGAYKIKVIPSEYTLVQGEHGPKEVLSRNPIIAQFSKQGITEYEREAALEHFRFKGIAEGEDPLRRISSYDTDQEAAQYGWDKKTKEEIERVLDLRQGVDYFRVDKPRAIAPWPTYDKTPPGKVLQMVSDMGIDPDAVMEYERENKNRPQIIEALEAEVTDDEEIVVPA